MIDIKLKNRGVPFLDSVDVLGFAVDDRYMNTIVKARIAWPSLIETAKSMSVTLPEPRLWLVQTEVA